MWVHFGHWGGGFYEVIGLSEMQMDSSIMLLTNLSILTTFQNNGLLRVWNESSSEDVMLHSNSIDEGTQMVDLAMNLTPPFNFPYYSLLHHLHDVFVSMNLLLTRHCI